MRILVPRLPVFAMAVCALAATGCSATVAGTAVPVGDASSSFGFSSSPDAVGASGSTDCATLTEVLGPLVSDRPEVTETSLPGFDEPMCMWSRGGANMAGALTMIVKEEPHDPAVIEHMRTMSSTRSDPRAEPLGAVVLDVVGFALLTPTHNIIANSVDPAVDDATKLDMVFAVAEYLQK